MDRNSLRTIGTIVVTVMLVSSMLFAAPAASNHQCGVTDSVLALAYAGPSVLAEATGGSAIGCDLLHEESVNTDETDAEQLKIDLYASSQTKNAQSEVYFTSLDNYLNDSTNQALVAGKNDYIRALENGSSESAALTQAKGAVSDYYATKQLNLISEFNSSVSHLEYLQETYQNESGVDTSEIQFWDEGQSDSHYDDEVLTFQTTTETLVNGTEKTTRATGASSTNLERIGTVNQSMSTTSGDPYDLGFIEVAINAPNENYERLTVLDFVNRADKWQQIQNLNGEAQSEIETFVSGTYDEYEQGDINTSDLVDPYLASQEYSPQDDYQTWAISSLQSLGVDGPTNPSEVGHMNVTDHSDGETHNGLLLSDGLPENDSFIVGERYNASNITGPQYLVTDSEQVTLEGEFTLNAVVSPDGEEQDSVQYRNVTYETADIGEYQALMDELADTRMEIEAREEELEGGGGGFWPDFGLGGIGTPAIIAGAVVIGLLLFGRE